jgi:hypothetical protein
MDLPGQTCAHQFGARPSDRDLGPPAMKVLGCVKGSLASLASRHPGCPGRLSQNRMPYKKEP